MAAQSSTRDRRTARLGLLTGTILVIVVGLLLQLNLGTRFAHWSYDLTFLGTSRNVPTDLVMVYIDPLAKSRLGQAVDQPLDRKFHARLVDRLSREGARLVVFDILFDGPQADPNSDTAFAEAIRKNGKVVLVGEYLTQWQGEMATSSAIPPIDILKDAAAGWGLANVVADSDQEVRFLSPGAEDFPSVSWVAAALLGAETTRPAKSRSVERWLNYYCEPTALNAVNIDRALSIDELPAGYFRDKIVVVGSRPDPGVSGAKGDVFRTPYSATFRKDTLKNEPMAPGATIQAFALLNLVRGDWLTRLRSSQETTLIFIWGIFISVVLARLRPWLATLAAPLIFLTFALIAVNLHGRYHLWFAWLIPAGAQTSVALIWSVGFQYLIASRRRHEMHRRFGPYLSKYMVKRIAESDFDPSLGGKEEIATIMFTDLEGFTNMSETLPPAEVSHILTSYFNETTRAILEQEGTIIKYIGDAVMAAWNAPMPEPRHAERAVLAAWGMLQSGRKEIAGRTLRTRIGINTGKVLAGNLGSEFRFDYTAIGDTTNTASRLEGLNKFFGTDLLIGDATKTELSQRIRTRMLGRFLMSGKSQPLTVHEVLGVDLPPQETVPWVTAFDEAVRDFTARKLDEAEQLFRQAIHLRGSQDGLSEFYLRQIIAARATEPSSEGAWDGVIVISSK